MLYENSCLNCNASTFSLRFTFSEITEACISYKVNACLSTLNSALLENTILAQLVKKRPTFLWNQKVYYLVQRHRPLDPVLKTVESNPHPVY